MSGDPGAVPVAVTDATARRPREVTVRRASMSLARYAFLGFWAALCILPMILVISTAFKDPLIDTGNPFQLFSSFRPQNLIDAWTLGNFGRYFLNTIVIMVPVVLGVVVLSTMAGYAFARFVFPGRERCSSCSSSDS